VEEVALRHRPALRTLVLLQLRLRLLPEVQLHLVACLAQILIELRADGRKV
jgi:hypothetical protein